MTRTTTPAGFTLIELLVSIGIIGILLGVLVPATASALATARRSACMANLRGIGQATAMYRQENRDRLPVAVWPAHAGTTATSPWDALEPFIDAPAPVHDLETGEATTGQPWACPADREVASASGYSYHYAPMMFFQVLGERQHTAINRAFAEADAVIFLDAVGFHPGHGPARQNALRGDGSVRQFLGRVCAFR